MLYKKYYNRMEKLAKVVETIKKYRVLIISIIGALLVMLIAFLSVQGIITEDITVKSDHIVYGQTFKCDSQSLFGKTGYQYRNSADGKWRDGLPVEAGEYYIRAYSVRTFGVKNYGKPLPVTVDKKPLTLSVENQTVVYGETLTTIQDGLVRGDQLYNAEFDYNKNFGSSYAQIKPDTVVIHNKKGGEVTNSYDISFVGGNVYVNKKQVSLTVTEISKTYDGTPLSWVDVELSTLIEDGMVTMPELAYSDRLELTFTKSITDYGRVKNSPDYKIFNEDGQDITSNYLVLENFGELIIDKRELSVKPKNLSKTYDAQPLTAQETEILDGSIVDGQTFDGQVCNGEITEVGTEVSSLLDLKIKFGDQDKTFNYDITFKSGELTIVEREISLSVTAEKVYDANPLVANDVDISYLDGELVSGQELLLLSNDAIAKQYGVQEVEYTVFDNGIDVTSNYLITLQDVLMEISKREITITALSASKIYDSTPLVKDGFTTENIIDGHVVDATVEGSITDVGEPVANTITFISVMNGETDVSDNYQVMPVNGLLEITPRSVSVKIDARKVYDDTLDISTANLTKYVTKMENDGSFSDGLYDGQTLSVNCLVDTEDTSAVIHYGVMKADVDSYEVVNGLKQNYSITWLDGDLTIDKRDLIIKTLAGSKVYNGEFQTNEQAIYYNLVEWHDLSYKEWVTLQDVSTTENSVVVDEIKDKNDNNNEKDNYNVYYDFEEFSITPRQIFLSFTEEKTYDSEFFEIENVQNFTYKSGSLEFVDGHLLRLKTNGVNAKTYSDSEVLWGIYDSETEYTLNYQLDLTDVLMTINKKSLSVRIKDVQKYYDAETYSVYAEECEANGLLATHKFYAQTECGNTSVGEWSITIANETDRTIPVWQVKCLDGSEEIDVSENYFIDSVQSGTLTIDKCSVSVKVDLHKGYDDTADTANAQKVVSILRYDGGDILYADHEFEFQYNLVSIANAGEYPLEIISYKILSDSGDVGGNYDVHTEEGKYIIDKLDIVLSTGSKTKIYDGIELSMAGIEISEGSLISGHVIVEGTAPSILRVGEIVNEIPFKIEKDQVDKTDNYNVTFNAGILNIKERKINVLISDYTATYNGNYHSFDNLSWIVFGGDGMLGSDVVTSIGEYVATKNGVEYTDQLGLIDSGHYVITANPVVEYQDHSYTGYYKFTFEMGNFIINKVELHVVSKSIESKEAISPSHTINQWYLSLGEMAYCDSLAVEVSGSQYQKGQSANVISSITITNADGEEEVFIIDTSISEVYESKNYLIRVSEGMLTVK